MNHGDVHFSRARSWISRNKLNPPQGKCGERSSARERAAWTWKDWMDVLDVFDGG